MGLKLLPFIIMAFFLSAVHIQKQNIDSLYPINSDLKNEAKKKEFFAYRDAVRMYHDLYPAYIGVVSNEFIKKTFPSVSDELIARSGNAIYKVGRTGGTRASSYSLLSPAERNEVAKESYNDESIGVVEGSYWRSFSHPNFVEAIHLYISPPDGSTISISITGL